MVTRFTLILIQKIKIEADKNNYQIIMTEKDYFKVKDYKIKGINYLKVLLKITNKEKLIQIIKKSYGKNN